ncbi:MAG: peptide deformylase [Burkholderiales bacterium]|nr:peptide deformylase [Burkholderiales bacterium]
MAILKILQYPDERLHLKANPVEEFGASLEPLVADMLETMYAAPGVGLAATQVDVQKQIIVIDISEQRNRPVVLINPEIVSMSGKSTLEEGCLSVPGIYETVNRAERIKARARNLKGEAFEIDADGLLSICIQHEIDHLKGKVFVEYLSRLKQTRILAKMKKLARERM